MKQKLKFTPGKNEMLPRIELEDGSVVLLTGYDPACGPRQAKRRTEQRPTMDTRNGLGQLFAAAPDLLAMLQELTTLRGPGSLGYIRAMALIAKAGGAS